MARYHAISDKILIPRGACMMDRNESVVLLKQNIDFPIRGISIQSRTYILYMYTK